MTSLERRPTFDPTSAAGAMHMPRVCEPVLVGCVLVGLGTSTAYATTKNPVWRSPCSLDQTTSGAVVPTARTAGAAIGELRRLSGLTWDQLARIFRVSRGSLHFWASGKPMAPSHEEHLQRVLAAVRTIDRGSASANRTALLGACENGSIPLDLLVAGDYERFVSLLGRGEARRVVAPNLSKEARAARAPRAPEELVGALQDRVHREFGALRAAKSVRVRSDR